MGSGSAHLHWARGLAHFLQDPGWGKKVRLHLGHTTVYALPLASLCKGGMAKTDAHPGRGHLVAQIGPALRRAFNNLGAGQLALLWCGCETTLLVFLWVRLGGADTIRSSLRWWYLHVQCAVFLPHHPQNAVVCACRVRHARHFHLLLLSMCLDALTFMLWNETLVQSDQGQ